MSPENPKGRVVEKTGTRRLAVAMDEKTIKGVNRKIQEVCFEITISFWNRLARSK
jgi:hypothetical protein